MSDGFLGEEKAREVLASGQLPQWLRVRLVMIAGGASASAAVRAIEMLMSGGSDVVEDDFVGIPLDKLVSYEQAAAKRLRQLEEELRTTRINADSSGNTG